MENSYSVILFYSTNYAVYTSNLLKDAKKEYKMIPVPRHLSSDCGYCVRINSGDIEDIKPILENNSIEFSSIEKL